MKKLLRRLWFPVALWWAKRALIRTNNMWSYPMMVYMEFNRDEVFTLYVSGSSMYKIIATQAEATAERMAKNLKRKTYKDDRRAKLSMDERIDLYERYYDFCFYYEDKAEHDEFMQELDDIENSEAFQKGL